MAGGGALRSSEVYILHVPAHEASDGFLSSQGSHVERCPPSKPRRRGPRSLRALMRREEHRFTPSAGAPGESGAVPLAGTPADVQNLELPSPCRAEILVALPCRNSIASSDRSLRRLRELNTVVVTSASPSVFPQRVRVWSVNCCKLLKRRAEL